MIPLEHGLSQVRDVEQLTVGVRRPQLAFVFLLLPLFIGPGVLEVLVAGGARATRIHSLFFHSQFSRDSL